MGDETFVTPSSPLRHSLTPVPYLLVHPSLTHQQTEPAHSSSRLQSPVATVVATTASPRGHGVATTATVYPPNPIEDITIGSNNGYITIPLNIIELQSMYW
jgi:hypothetical protein